MDSPITTIGLCAGVGWLDEGVRAGLEYLGFRHRTACYVERDCYAAAVLLARMEESSLEPAPVWCGDLADFDGRAFRGAVDGIIAGLPCQPYSNAGRRQGNSDRRSYGDGDGPIPHALRIIDECDASVVFFENVPAWVTGGWFRPVGEELCRMGFEIEDPLFVTAESVGASHRRERVFILAYRERARWPQAERQSQHAGSESAARGGQLGLTSQPAGERDTGAVSGAKAKGRRTRLPDGSRTDGSESPSPTVAVTWSDGGRISQPGRGPSGGTASGGTGAELGNATSDDEQRDSVAAMHGEREPTGGSGGSLGDADQPGLQGRRLHGRERADERIAREAGYPLFAPGPGADWGGIPEWLWPATQPGVRVLVDGSTLVLDESRADQLRCSGNGVVALCAGVAFVELVRRASSYVKGSE